MCPAGWGLWFGLFVYKREDSSLCPPAAVKTGLENQSEVSSQELNYPGKKPARTNKAFLMQGHLRSHTAALWVRTQVTGKTSREWLCVSNLSEWDFHILSWQRA